MTIVGGASTTSATGSSTLSFGQLEQLWVQAGGSKTMAPIMAAIALAESGGNPNATNKNDNGGKQTSWGLWQISNGTHNQPVSDILNPLVNAQQAVAKLSSQGLSAWGTYTSGDYLKDLPAGSQSSAAVAQLTADTTTASTSSTYAGKTGGQYLGLEDPTRCIFGFGGIIAGLGSTCFLNALQVRKIKGWSAMIGGGSLALVGVVLLATNVGKSTATKAVGAGLSAVPGIGLAAGVLGRGLPGISPTSSKSAPSRTSKKDDEDKLELQQRRENDQGVERAHREGIRNPRKVDAGTNSTSRSSPGMRRRQPDHKGQQEVFDETPF